MRKSIELSQLRGQKLEEIQALVSTAEAENRNLTDAEKNKFNELDKEITNLEEEIAIAERSEVLAQKAAAAKRNKMDSEFEARGTKEHREELQAAESFSLAKMLRQLANKEQLTGAEAEVAQEARKEMAQTGLELRGVGLPVKFLQKRAAIVAGSNTSIPTVGGGFIDDLREYTRVMQLGATMMTGLSGNVTMTKLGAGVATWEGETDANAESGATLTGVVMSPKRLSAKTYVSHQFLIQNPENVEQILRNDLLLALGEAVDKAAISGVSGGDNPIGIINFSGAGSVVIGATGGAITRAKVLEMISTQISNKALRDGVAFLTSGRTFMGMGSIAKDAGSGLFLNNISAGVGNIEGFRAEFSNHVPINLTKSTGTNLSALILGDFRQLMIGQWGVVDLVVDPYTVADEGQVKVVVNSFFDVKARHEKAFTVCKDITT